MRLAGRRVFKGKGVGGRRGLGERMDGWIGLEG